MTPRQVDRVSGHTINKVKPDTLKPYPAVYHIEPRAGSVLIFSTLKLARDWALEHPTKEI